MSFYFLVDKSRDDLEVDFDKNVTHLFESISASEWDAALAHIEENPDEARTWVARHHDDGQIMWRFLPIHSACARQPPAKVIDALIVAYRYGLKCKDDQGILPLHYACGNQASVETIQFLLLGYPEAAKVTDTNGMLPLHYLTQWGPSSIEAIDVLLFANRAALQEKDNDGNTPLDLARDGDYENKENVLQALQQYMFPSLTSFSNLREQSSSSFLPVQASSPSTPKSLPLQTIDVETVNVKSVTTINQTSDAVRRLQEAAEKQQRARESYLKGSDYNNIVKDGRDVDYNMRPKETITSTLENNQNPSKISVVASPSMIDDGTSTYTMDPATQSLVATLKAEVEKLRAESKRVEAEAQRQLNSERVELEKLVNERKAKLASCEKETRDSLSELKSKDENAKRLESKLKEKETEFDGVMKTNDQLRKDLEMTKQHISNYKEKSSKLSDYLSALSKSMASMMVEQEQIMIASSKHEEYMKNVTMKRQKKMQELIDQEVEFAKMSLDNKKRKELGSEDMINTALENQKKLMGTIVGVLGPKVQ